VASSAADTVLLSVDRGVAVVTLNRPERLNAWTFPMSARFFDAIEACDDDPEVRVIVVTGAGRGFCAGMDTGALKEVGTSAPVSDPNRRRADSITRVRKPVIAGVNGAAVGVGFAIACACDIRFAATGAKLGALFPQRALPSEDGLSWLLPRIVGLSAALDILLSGRILLAEEAAGLGLVKDVLPAEQVLPRALEYARDIAANCSPTALAMIKRQVYGDGQATLEDSLRLSQELRDQLVVSADFAEAMSSYSVKRAANFAPLPPREGGSGATRRGIG
jgi:enoyl-CoA hydratase/carnithine racemase